MKAKKKQCLRKKDGGIIRLEKFIFVIIISLFLKPFDLLGKTTISIIRDPEIEFFIQKMINNFTENDIDKFNIIRPIIVVNKTPNAFVTGDSKIFIHTGLLESIDSFEELEGIIAHEIGHLKLGHVQNRILFNKKTLKMKNTGIFALVGLSMSGLNTNIEGAMLAGKDFLLKNQFRYSRNQEIEADIYSIKALNKKNKSSKGLINFFQKIQKYNQLYTNKNHYYNSHPSSKSRLEVINSLSKVKSHILTKNLSYKQLNFDLEKLKIKLIAYSKNKNKLDNIKLTLTKKNVTYYKTIKDYINDDLNNLYTNISILKIEHPNDPFIFEMSGNINFYNNKKKNAVDDFKKSIKIFEQLEISIPTLVKFSLAHAYIKLNTKEALQNALKILEEIMPFEHKTRKLWRLIGIASTRLNIKSISLIAQAEEEVLKKRLKKAKYFANLALKEDNLNNLYKFRAIDILNIN